MRTITLGGRVYPIRASVQMLTESAQIINDILQAAEERAAEQADLRKLDEDVRGELIAAARKTAYWNYLQDSQHSMNTIAALINGAVDAERVLHGHDIREQIPEYPLTGEKIIYLATLQDLNDFENAKAIAEEMAAASGGSKNVLTGNMTELLKTIL